ncbi:MULTISPECIES: VOC family protein [Rhodococcus]|uniref:VOC family protein n=1 Tax=Rhodococcus TaxID=1827 RepID=UPI00029A3E49|nr:MULTISPECIES: VOC family protein [Rhodococcus]ATQ31916.1 glyoxalase [Rhodococcus ruber]AWH01806.1 glyoxalase [Rhodococcus ruber]MCF8785539.1 VOC family protein [Rhodococcus ruber]MDV3208102.1 VOC family protein [Rhodococcus ruber]
MQITASALSLNVPDVAASADFATRHLGFTEAMAEDGFVSLTREDAGFNLVFLRTGLGSFKPASIAGDAGQGTLVAFVVDTIDDEYERLQAEGVPIVTPIETEPWGERYFQMRDPNGIVYQLVQWVDEPSSAS